MTRRMLVGSSAKDCSAKAPVAIEESLAEASVPPPWRISLQYFKGTTNDLLEALTGQWDTVPQDGLRLSVGRAVVQDFCDLPMDIFAYGGLMWHNERGVQPDLFQWTLSVSLEWREFPWSQHLRTRFGMATGISYAEHIPVAEVLNRGERSSSHLLHYVELTLAFNCSDIIRFFNRTGWSAADNLWIIASIPHRSGAWGLYGDDKNGKQITGGSNYLAIGFETQF